MRVLTARPALYVLVLVGISAGCASAGRTRQEPTSSSTITAKDIEEHPNEPIEKILERKVPGVSITRRADGGIAIRLRGASSISGSDTQPLYVLNDLPIEADSDGGLPGVSPYEIEKITVLKGADAAVYGIRGANGVIVITTKKPGAKR